MFLLTGLASMALAQQEPLDNSAYVEANRPLMAPRTLRADELKVMRSLVTRRPDDVTIAALRPYAEAGDIEALQAVVLGYVGLRDQSKKTEFGSRIGRPSDKYTALAGVWAAQLWQSKQDYSKNYARLVYNAIKPCLGDVQIGVDFETVVMRTGTRKTYDCGFDTRTSEAQIDGLFAQGKSKDRGSGPFQFIFRPVKPQSEIDARRLTRVMRNLRGQLPDASPPGVWEDTLEESDFYWASEYAHGNPEAFSAWVDADFVRALRNARIGKRLAPGTSTWLYMKADPKREQTYAYSLSLHASELAGDRQLFLTQMDGATFGDRKRLHDIAVREGGDFAERWFRKFGSGLLGSELSVIGWCNIGASSACGPATQEVQRLEYLRKNGTPCRCRCQRICRARPARAVGSLQEARGRHQPRKLRAGIAWRLNHMQPLTASGSRVLQPVQRTMNRTRNAISDCMICYALSLAGGRGFNKTAMKTSRPRYRAEGRR